MFGKNKYINKYCKNSVVDCVEKFKECLFWTSHRAVLNLSFGNIKDDTNPNLQRHDGEPLKGA